MTDIDSSAPVLVTGASGYIASWIVRFLLEGGYTVHGTVRDMRQGQKFGHLYELAKKEKGSLRLFEADLLHEGAFRKAMEGCGVVIHTASPFRLKVKDPRQDLVDPARKGTLNVLATVNELDTVQRVVLTSSVAAVYGDAIELADKPNGMFTEDDWNLRADLDYQPYSFSKTIAEKEAWALAEAQDRWSMVALQPGFVLGPSLSDRSDSTSIDFMLSMVNGNFKSGVPDLYFGIVDVRDVAQAHIRAGFNPEASGRNILTADELGVLEMGAILRTEFGKKYPLPRRILPKWLLYILGPFRGYSWSYIRRNAGYPVRFDNSCSMENLGMTYRPVSETLIEQVHDFERKGMI